MQSLSLITAVIWLAATAKGDCPDSVTIAYYPNHNCTEANHFATLEVDKCYGPVYNFAQSFNAVLLPGYYVYGWNTPDCTGSSPVVQAFGPDSECFITGESMGDIAEAQSFILHKA